MTAQIVQRFSIRNAVWNRAAILYNLRRQPIRSNSPTKMPVIQLPDGSERQFDDAVTGTEIASDISKSLARDAVAIRVDGEMWDLGRRIEDDVLTMVAIDEAGRPIPFAGEGTVGSPA